MPRQLRTQIYLPRELSAALDGLARARGTSRAELLRIAASEFLERVAATGPDPIDGVVGLGAGRSGRVSEEHDRYLAAWAARETVE